MVLFYIAYARYSSHKSFSAEIAKAIAASGVIYFPNGLMDIIVLNRINDIGENALAHYYLGNLYYDKRQYDLARDHWLAAERMDPRIPTVHRNLSLYYYNKAHDPEQAVSHMERAWSLDRTDGRVLLELTSISSPERATASCWSCWSSICRLFRSATTSMRSIFVWYW